MRRLGRGTLAALLALSLAGSVQAQDAQAPAADPRGLVSIQIRAATYGHAGMATDCSVIGVVQRQCEGKLRCVIDVNDSLCPPPAQLPSGLILTLSVQYRCERTGPSVFKAADKPFQLTLACHPPN